VRNLAAISICTVALSAAPAFGDNAAKPAHESAAKPKSSFIVEAIPAVPEPSVAWLLALGFLGIVVLRRTRSGPI
jgi:PEP-CTERM motif-containing protein